ncbi:MAG TPA: DUF4082 domain-containing protein [Verrucomicrobiae bacterium]|nr:DUF4082 domain-containing protein [Verrucomicrobiae bacterium]
MRSIHTPTIWQAFKWRYAAFALLAVVAIAGIVRFGFAGASQETYSLWGTSAKPRIVTDPDILSVELGVRFNSSKSGKVTGVEFYKGSKNRGTHVGSLWDNTGKRLASVTFKSETASGWQTAAFPEPVQIEANKIYTVSYHAPRGHYSVTEHYFTKNSRTNGPLTAPKSGPELLNGVYAYGSNSSYPTSSYRGSNYWVDVLFIPDTTQKPTIPEKVTAEPEKEGITVTWQASSAVGDTISEYIILRNDQEIARVPGSELRYHDTQGLENNSTYSYRVQAIDSNGRKSDLSIAAEVLFLAPVSVWPDNTIPAVQHHDDTESVELGVKFRSHTNGKVLGVKFYKGEKNTGQHTGSLWDAQGNKLASVSFTNESTAGWQRAYFSEPVAIAANTTYIVSYHAPHGFYAAEPGYFHNQAAKNGPLSALQNHTDGENGVYKYGASSFPTHSYNAANYWVDVIFRPTATTAQPTVPANVTATQNQAAITVAWQPSTSPNGTISGYRIFRNGNQIAALNGDARHFTDNQNLEDQKTYGYQVQAIDVKGEVSELSSAVGVVYIAPKAPVDLKDLPRVPWEGGPSFYEQFPQAKSHGWTNPHFFPIGLWGATVENQRDVDTDKAIGINTYLEIYKDGARPNVYPNFEAIRQSGMSAIHQHTDAPNVGNETVGWFVSDEPEQFGQAPGQVLNHLKTKKAQLPKDGRFHYTNFTGNMILPNYTPGDTIAAEWLDQNDVVSLDIYWYTRDLVCGGSVAGEIWKDGSGAKQPHGNGYNDLSYDECHRASNYGHQIDAQRRLAALSGKREPVWGFIETGHPFTDPENRGITPNQLAGAVWNSLIHEARGINYFNHSFSGPCQSSNVVRDPLYVGRDCYAAIRAKVKQVNAQITELAPVLNSQSFSYSFNPKLDTMLKEKNGSYYIFAMPAGVKGGSATSQQSLRLPNGLTASKAEVLFENRSLPITDGQFTDTFAADHTYHIYKITP